MPFPLAFPTNVHPDRVRVVDRYAAAAHTSPITLVPQVYDWGNRRWEIEVTLQPMYVTEAAVWSKFFFDLKGMVGTFTLNLNPYCPGVDPAPGVVTFRLANPDPGWDARMAREFSFTFRAIQDL